MSRSQKNARLKVGPTAKIATGEPTRQAELTQKDGAANIAGDVNNFTTDDYGPMKVVKEPPY